MIKAKKGRVKIGGVEVPELLTEFTTVCMAVYDTLKEEGIEKEGIRDIMQHCFELGTCDTFEDRLKLMTERSEKKKGGMTYQ